MGVVLKDIKDGTRPGRSRDDALAVMAGLVPAIHDLPFKRPAKTWMPATSAGMTVRYVCRRRSYDRPPADQTCDAADAADRRAAAGGNLPRQRSRNHAPTITARRSSEAWVAAADDEEAFAARLAGELTLVATVDGAAVGFASLAGNDAHRHALCRSGRGRAGRRPRMLFDALEKLAAARGAKELSVDASDTARGLFESAALSPRPATSCTLGGEWLANTTMIKQLRGGRPRKAVMKRADMPFQRHWLYYLVLKYAVIAARRRSHPSTPSIGFIGIERKSWRDRSAFSACGHTTWLSL